MRIGSAAATGAVLLSLIACDANAPEGSSALELTGPSEAFGPVPIGSQGPPRTFTLTNKGDATTRSLLVRLSGPDVGEFAIVRDDCSGLELRPRTACRIEVHLRPVTEGPKEAQLAVADGSGRTASASLGGSGAGRTVVLPVGTHDFGRVAIDAMSPPFEFLVQSPAGTGGDPLEVALSGAQAGQFEIFSNTCSGRSIGTGGSCRVAVRFHPTIVGASTATLMVSTPSGSSGTSTLFGIGGSPGSLTISPAEHDFGVVRVDAPEAVITAIVTNQSVAEGASIAVRLEGADPGDFAVRSDGCSGRELPPGRSCSLQVAFLPRLASSTAVLQVMEPFGAGASLALRGAGAPLSTLDAAPEFLTFGPTIVGGASAALPVVVTNVGDVSSGPLAPQVLACDYYYGCAPSAIFVIESNGCASQDLPPGGTCEILVNFRPAYHGLQQARLEVGNVAVQLEGIGAGLGLEPQGLTFPSTPSGSASASQFLTVVNTSATATGPITSQLHVSGFTSTDGCAGVSLAPGASCSIAIVFAPSNPGWHSGDIMVSASPGGTTFAALQGQAIP